MFYALLQYVVCIPGIHVPYNFARYVTVKHVILWERCITYHMVLLLFVVIGRVICYPRKGTYYLTVLVRNYTTTNNKNWRKYSTIPTGDTLSMLRKHINNVMCIIYDGKRLVYKKETFLV